MELVGRFLRTKRGGKREPITQNREEVKNKLIAEKDTLTGAYAGGTFIFRKK
jgi:hypothetical protein